MTAEQRVEVTEDTLGGVEGAVSDRPMPDYAGHSVFRSHETSGSDFPLGGAVAIDLRVQRTYDLNAWPRPPNPSGRRCPITAYSTKSAVGAWALSMRPKTSSLVATSR